MFEILNTASVQFLGTIDTTSKLADFMINNPTANRWLSILIILAVICIGVKIIQSILQVAVVALIVVIAFNVFWGKGLDDVVNGLEISDYVNPETAETVIEEYKNLERDNSGKLAIPGTKGREALKIIINNSKEP